MNKSTAIEIFHTSKEKSKEWNASINFFNIIIPFIIHELIQPIMVAKTYSIGTMLRFQKAKLNDKQILYGIKKINYQLELMENTIRALNDVMDIFTVH